MDPTHVPDDPDHTVPTRRVVDVTDRLAPGAKALVRERTERMADATRDRAWQALDHRLAAALNLDAEPVQEPHITLGQALARARTALDAGLAGLDEQAAHPPLVVARLRDAVDAARAQQGPIPAGFDLLIREQVTAVRRHEEEALRAAFAAGRAYERGAAIRRRVGKSLAARRAAAQEAAREHLDERTPDAPRLAAMVLAGFTGTEFP